MDKQNVNRSYLLLGFGILNLLLTAQGSLAQSSHTSEKIDKIKVMVVGAFHFHHAPDYYNIMSDKRQKEIKKVVRDLAEFKPTKIALEASYKDSAKFDRLYAQYRAGNHRLTNNERQQLGFRLAEHQNHETVYTVDFILRWPYGEVMSWAEKNAPGFMSFYHDWKEKMDRLEEPMYQEATVTEYFRWLNSNKYRDLLKEVRMKRMELGAGSNFIGVKPISSSYERNLKIFANIMKYAEPGDRIIVIFGAGHSYFLREFVQMHPDTRLVETLDYL